MGNILDVPSNALSGEPESLFKEGSLFTISSDALPMNADVVSIKGTEGLSDLYRFEIGVQVSGLQVDYSGAVNQRATLHINSAPHAPAHHLNGIMAEVELLHAFGNTELYRIVLVPELWKLTLTRHNRVFTNEPIVSIIGKVLGEAGIKFSFDLQGGVAPPREFVAQYKESSYNFISRWMEREGMFYYFVHGDGQEKMVITNHNAQKNSLRHSPVRYTPLSEGCAMALEALDSFRCKSRMLPKRVEMADYNYNNPSLEVLGRSAVSSSGFGDVNMYGHNFKTPLEAARYARIRGQAHLAAQDVYTGWGRVFNLRSGYPFVLEEHPRLNNEYYATEVQHFGCQAAASDRVKRLLDLDFDFEGEYRCRVKAIRAKVVYKSPERFAWPRVEGYEHAVVCGQSASPYAQMDSDGRYLVRFMFDESDLGAGKASARVRLQQPYGGGQEGFHFNLVKGTEVAVYFAGGDPDRPLIAGVAPNPQKPSPSNAGNHTKNMITTINDNRIWLEDTKGSEFLQLYSPASKTTAHLGAPNGGYNMLFQTDGQAMTDVGGDQVIDISQSLNSKVGSDASYDFQSNFEQKVASNWKNAVGGDGDNKYDGNYSRKIGSEYKSEVDGNTSYDFKSDWTIKVAGNKDEKIEGNLKLEIGGDEINKTAGQQSNTVGNGRKTTITGNDDLTISGNYTVDVGGNYSLIERGKKDTITYGNTKSQQQGNHVSITFGAKEVVTVGNVLSVTAGAQTTASVGPVTSLDLAGKVRLAIAYDISNTAGLRSVNTVTEIKNDATAVYNFGAKVSNAGVRSIQSGARNIATGIFNCVSGLTNLI